MKAKFLAIFMALAAMFFAAFSAVQAQIPRGNVLALDGACDYVQFSSSPSLNLTEAITLEAWVYLQSNADSGDGIVVKRSSFPDPSYGLFFSENNAVRFQVYTVNHGTISPAPTPSLGVGEWHHVAGIYKATEGSASIFLDGKDISKIACTDPKCYNPIQENSASVFLGISPWPVPACPQPEPGEGQKKVSGYFKGLIDEVRVWETVRTTDQINALMFRKVPLSERQYLAGYWTMDELNQSSVAHDFSGNGNHGQLIGDAHFVGITPTPAAPPAPRAGSAATTWGRIKSK